MGYNTRFFLDDLEIDEPVSWDSFTISIKRDDELHGIGFEASVTSLEFYGSAMRYIDSIKASQGLKSNIIFKAEEDCDDNGQYETIIEGKLNMGKYQKKCGITCSVSLPVEATGCEVSMINRMDQTVDVDKTISQNGLVTLPSYPQLGIQLELPPKELDYLTEGNVIENDEPLTFTNIASPDTVIRPIYADLVANNFKQSQLEGTSNLAFLDFGVISPNILWDERNINFPNPILITGRLKGTLSSPVDIGAVRLFVIRGEMTADNYDFANPPYQVILNVSLHGVLDPPSTLLLFDESYSYSWSPIDNGADGIYAFIEFGGSTDPRTIAFDPETFFKAESTKVVPATVAQVYMVHETLSRIVENITDSCMRVKSSYYGRTDSQPFSFDDDGCGGLRCVASGLKIRKALNASFFTNLREIVKGLQDIDNIGMGVEPDEDLAGRLLLRIEELDYFYQDFEIFKTLNIAEAQFNIEEDRDNSIVKIGYKKWETLANFGLDEINSNREYHLDIDTLNKIADHESTIVAGGYAIEVTREQSVVDSSNADTTYDNETFIICLKRLTYNTFEVEKGNINNPQNIFSPQSTYNYRISPLRNLMRWYRSLINAYPTLGDSQNKLFFSSGTGNFIASGQLSEGYGYGSEFCKLEGVDIAENMNLFVTAFNNIAKYIPLWKNETITYTYPMSLRDYNYIKARRYGYITYSCGDSTPAKGWIKDIEYNLAKGEAVFVLRQKWEQ